MAGKVLPKLKVFFFLSVLCMIINIGVCIVAFADSNTANTDYYLGTDSYQYQDNIESEGTNVTALNFIGGTATSFIPFASIISVAFLNLDTTIFILISFIIVVIGALQLLMLVLIGLCFVPNVLGSGVDV